MNNLLKLEQIAIFGFSIFLFAKTDFAWWWFPVLILSPDISMLGYLVNTKIGAFFYNFFHHQALALLVLVLGWQLKIDWLYLAGIILVAHSSMDRVFGYGLKYPDDFKHTHLSQL